MCMFDCKYPLKLTFLFPLSKDTFSSSIFFKCYHSSAIALVHLASAKASYNLLRIEADDNCSTQDTYDLDNFWEDT